MLGLISITLFPLSLILLLVLLPIVIPLLICCSVGIVSLWLSLRFEGEKLRYMRMLPVLFLPFCICLTYFFANSLAPKAHYTHWHLDLLALQAHFIYPVLVIVLAVLNWSRKYTSVKPQVADSSSYLQTILTWMAILAFWTLSVFALLGSKEPIRQYLQQFNVDSARAKHGLRIDRWCSTSRLLKSVGEDAKARKKTAETGVYKWCEDFEDVFDAALATQVAFQQPARPLALCASRAKDATC